MPRPIHFEIHAENPERAQRFYTGMFGWTFTAWGDQQYWLIKTGDPGQPGIDGGLLPRPGPAPIQGQGVNAFVCTVDVANVDQAVSRAQSLGGSVALPKMPVPGIGWLVYVIDTEGNIFGMMQNDPGAK